MRKRIIRVFVVLLALAAVLVFASYSILFKSNIQSSKSGYIYIKSSDDYADVRQQLIDSNILLSVTSFDLLADRMNLASHFKAGKYKIEEGSSNLKFIRRLRSGKWENQIVKIKAEMSRDSLINYLASLTEANAEDIKNELKAPWIEEEGFTNENIYCIFLADHYYFNWATNAGNIVKRFYREYQKYWNKERLAIAYAKDLSAEEACILASIVDGEAIHIEEMPTIAGLYLNRLEKGMKLQADPTALYVAGREGRRRVLDKDLVNPSPYNTYVHLGLPPGPIMLIDKRAVNAVLNAEKHDYIYMCAKEDGSYYHYFTSSYRQHTINANKYRRMLNRQGIRH